MKKGFTLIELLVVVLIMGILASVAMPQYFSSVERARAGEAISVMGALTHEMDAWLMNRNNRDWNMNDISLPEGKITGTNYLETKYFKFYVWCSHEKTLTWEVAGQCRIEATRLTPNAGGNYGMSARRDPIGDWSPWYYDCWYENGVSQRVCAAQKGTPNWSVSGYGS